MRNQARCGVLLVVSLLVGCSGGDTVGPAWEDGPGTNAWNDSDDVDCESDDDCSAGESCESGVCQLKRCTDPAYASVAPLGQQHVFVADIDLAIVGDDSYVDGYEPNDGAYLESWDLEGQKVLDVAGGDFEGKRPDSIAVVIEGSKKIKVQGPGGVRDLDVGDMSPRRVAAGDTDADGIDELVVFGSGGSIAICDLRDDSCQRADIEGVEVKDVTAGDVDGDGYDEAVFLVKVGDERQMVIWNLDADKTAQEQSVGWSFGDADLRSVAAADLDGDGVAEVVALHESGWADFKDDRLFALDARSGDIKKERGINGHSIDVAAGDRNGDGKSEVAVLRSEQKFEVFKTTDGKLLESAYTKDLAVGNSASRIGALDWNGDSATGKLLSGPKLVSGSVLPIAAMTFPPYDRERSEGDGTVTIGSMETTEETMEETVSLHLALTATYGPDLGPIAKAEVSAYLMKDWSATHGLTTRMTVGQRYTLEADPAKYGDDYGGVILSCGCFHVYEYESDDPGDKIGGSGQPITVYVPVGGQTALWSTKRYNAMARALGGLPIIDIPTRVGDVASYPSSHQRLDGTSIPDDDKVFPEPPQYQVSDVGNVGWFLSVGETEFNKTAETTSIGMKATLGAFGASGSVEANVGFGTAYTIAVGKEAQFLGNVPPLPDDPETPEDEYQAYRYSFSPMVHREHYEDAAGEDAGFYVLSYSVGMQSGAAEGTGDDSGAEP
jgi:hypothetical protein